jgi:hypothetical protein
MFCAGMVLDFLYEDQRCLHSGTDSIIGNLTGSVGRTG